MNNFPGGEINHARPPLRAIHRTTCKMSGDTTPGQTGSVPCPHCRAVLFFPFTGGPHQLPCPDCKAIVSLEVVHDGTKWRTKLQRTP